MIEGFWFAVDVLRQESLFKRIRCFGASVLLIGSKSLDAAETNAVPRKRSDPPVIRSSWDDLLSDVSDRDDWLHRKQILRQ